MRHGPHLECFLFDIIQSYPKWNIIHVLKLDLELLTTLLLKLSLHNFKIKKSSSTGSPWFDSLTLFSPLSFKVAHENEILMLVIASRALKIMSFDLILCLGPRDHESNCFSTLPQNICVACWKGCSFLCSILCYAKGRKTWFYLWQKNISLALWLI